jgi:hypothetical protein
MQCPSAVEHLRCNEVTVVETLAVNRDGIDLGGCVWPTNLSAATGVAAARQVDYDDVIAERRPLALDPEELVVHLENEVISGVLYQGLQDRNTQLRSLGSDDGFRDVAFVVRVVHRTHVLI